MIFSKKKITMAYTLEQCTECSEKKKREFQEGDVLFAKTTGCSSCKGTMMVEKIFGETLE